MITESFKNYAKARKASDQTNMEYRVKVDNDVNQLFKSDYEFDWFGKDKPAPKSKKEAVSRKFLYTAKRQIRAFKNDPARPHIGCVAVDQLLTATYLVAALSCMCNHERHSYLRKYPFVNDCVKHKTDEGYKFNTPRRSVANLFDRFELKPCDHAEVLKSHVFLAASEMEMRNVLKQSMINFEHDLAFCFFADATLAVMANDKFSRTRNHAKKKKVLAHDGLTSEERLKKGLALKKKRLKAPFFAMKAKFEEIQKRLEKKREEILERKVMFALQDLKIGDFTYDNVEKLKGILRNNVIAQQLYDLRLE
jgi:hypothetical protein